MPNGPDSPTASQEGSGRPGVDAVLSAKGKRCAGTLAQAGTLARAGLFGARLDRLIDRAHDLLDEMDEVLALLHPARNPAAFSMAAQLHRELEQVQSAIPAADRGRPSATKAPSVE